MDSPAAIPAHG